jgi:exonuclease SbcC
VDALPPAWREQGASCRPEDVVGWRKEAVGLIGARDDRMALGRAREEQTARQRRLVDLEVEAAALPEAARRPVVELEDEERTVRAERQGADAQRKEREREWQVLEDRRVLRERLEAERRVALSGGQRFRVSVSLALGIGRWYAGEGGKRVESVIIDEGFGSLDKDGRRQMIEELHALQGVLGRILLVSHQEEFQTAFQNAYAIRLEGGTSVAALQGS